MGRWRGLVVTLMATWGMISSVNAAQTPCAIIDNQQGWPIIGEKCDIGNGLWGDQSPDPQSSAFWVQCGATNGVPSRQFYQTLRQGLPDLPFQVQVREGRGRCLIGPYQALDVANVVLKRVRMFGPTRQAVCAKPVNPCLSLQSYACRHWRRQKRLLCQRQAEKQPNPKPPSI
ncbi:SPOR domain-containing protein [Salinivibrio sp. EAGSL]|uniref:SPOR domain-containing protein n=1 Tax=Salinivibrio sp. EAGSL TaxID=2738468 RepID=UPI00158953D4|nr:SPOR domain-containing protein [Salinivibrio sp. EAGSL]NUY57035.1 SPOR domain-containing protein [Salinivibrio sp. EAGSL]